MNQLLDDIRKDAIKFANEERVYATPFDVFRAIGAILTLAEVTQNEGLLAMDDYLNTTDDSLPGNKFFKKIGMLVINATDPELIEEIGTTMYWTKEYTGYDGIVAYTYLRGFLLIQAGHHVHYIQNVLLSVLTDKELEMYNESEYKWTETEKSYKEYRIEFEYDTTQSLINYINESYVTMSDTEFKRFLESTDNNDMIAILAYLTDEAEQRLFANISERLRDMYIEDVKFQQYVNEESLRKVLTQMIGNIIAAKDKLNK